MTRYVVRVDDVGRRFGDDPEVGTDVELLDATKFCRPFREAGVPLVLGAVPAWFGEASLRRLWSDLADGDAVAVHGWDHRRGRVAAMAMFGGMKLLANPITGAKPRAYIPPFNAYDNADVTAWFGAGGDVFLGGIDGRDHARGTKPTKWKPDVAGAVRLHVPAREALYGRSSKLVDVVKTDHPSDRIDVLTLHVPWEVGASKSWERDLAALAEALAGKAVALDAAVLEWVR